MENINCPYCGKNESSKTSFAHHVCDKDTLRQRIDGLEAHAKMWHRESLRLAAKHSEDVFYYHGSPLEDDARLDQFKRLIACWNACEGISTEALESAKRMTVLVYPVKDDTLYSFKAEIPEENIVFPRQIKELAVRDAVKFATSRNATLIHIVELEDQPK